MIHAMILSALSAVNLTIYFEGDGSGLNLLAGVICGVAAMIGLYGGINK